MPRTLFVGVHNAGRSQIAEALYARRGGEARSAGTRPAGELYRAVVEALAEIGLDVSRRTPRPLGPSDVDWAELVVTMDGVDWPDTPAVDTVTWNVAEPAGLCLEEVRELCAVLEQKVAELPL